MAERIVSQSAGATSSRYAKPGTLTQPIVSHDCGIYKVTNTANGRVYIGSSKNIGRRFYLHKWDLQRGKHKSALFQRAWNKYGPEVFTFEVVLSCEEHNLLMYEQIFMDAYQSANPQHGMNICSVAGRTDNVKWTESQRAAFIADRRGRSIFKNNPVAYANKMASVLRGENHPFFGRKHTEESKKKMSEGRKKNGHPAWNKGKPHLALRGRPRSEEANAKSAATKRALYLASLGITREQAALIAKEALTRTCRSVAEQYGLKIANVENLKRQYQG